MKKIKLVAILYFSILIKIFGQDIKGVIVFKEFEYHDTIGMVESNREGTLLINITQSSSIYITGKKLNNLKSENIYEKKENGVIVGRNANPGSKKGITLYKSLRTKMLSYQGNAFGIPYIVSDKYPEISWSILDSIKSIKGLICQKAEGDFRGRHYIAWFINKISISDGPWKLCGLPGLILEAYDEKKHFIFEAQSIDFPKEFKESITPPTDGQSIDFFSYFKLEEKEIEELPKRIAAKFAENGGTVNSLKLCHNSIERNISE